MSDMARIIRCPRCQLPFGWHALKVDGALCIACLREWLEEQRQAAA